MKADLIAAGPAGVRKGTVFGIEAPGFLHGRHRAWDCLCRMTHGRRGGGPIAAGPLPGADHLVRRLIRVAAGGALMALLGVPAWAGQRRK